MKKLLSTSVAIICIFFGFNTTTLAQESQFKVGGGLAYGTEAEAIGIQAGATYGFTKDLSGAADFIIFFPENINWFEINVNGHYSFLAEDGMWVYGLAGLNYASISIDIPGAAGGGSVSNSEIGLNVGAGAEFDVDFANIYSELKYVLSNYDQLAISVGLRFPI